MEEEIDQMYSEKTRLEILVKYKDIEAKFTGNPDEVMRSLLKFVRQVIPAYEIVDGLTLTIDLENLLRLMSGLIAFTPEGIVVTISKDSLNGEKEIVLLHLIRAYIGYSTGRMEKDYLTTGELISLTGGKKGTVAARVSELTGSGWVERVGRGEYKVTTLGVKGFLEEILPKIKTSEDF